MSVEDSHTSKVTHQLKHTVLTRDPVLSHECKASVTKAFNDVWHMNNKPESLEEY